VAVDVAGLARTVAEQAAAGYREQRESSTADP
jgi:hypothetical protein